MLREMPSVFKFGSTCWLCFVKRLKLQVTRYNSKSMGLPINFKGSRIWVLKFVKFWNSQTNWYISNLILTDCLVLPSSCVQSFWAILAILTLQHTLVQFVLYHKVIEIDKKRLWLWTNLNTKNKMSNSMCIQSFFYTKYLISMCPVNVKY